MNIIILIRENAIIVYLLFILLILLLLVEGNEKWTINAQTATRYNASFILINHLKIISLKSISNKNVNFLPNKIDENKCAKSVKKEITLKVTEYLNLFK